MKLGQAEGTPEEIKGFLENHGMDPKDFFEKPAKPMNNAWYAIPGVIILFSVATLVFCTWISPAGKNFLFLLGAIGFFWCGSLIYQQLKNVWMVAGVVVFGILVMLVSMGAMAPMQMLEFANKTVETTTKKDK